MAIVPRQIDRIRILISDLLQFARPGELKFVAIDLKNIFPRYSTF
jgi:nitrogen fixation/metabolism regulation signal transduction histidine kinase